MNYIDRGSGFPEILQILTFSSFRFYNIILLNIKYNYVNVSFYSQGVGRPGSHRRYVYRCVDSNTAYSLLLDSARNHCNTYAAAGVVCEKYTDIHMHAHRLTSYNPHGCNKAFLFG